MLMKRETERERSSMKTFELKREVERQDAVRVFFIMKGQKKSCSPMVIEC